MTSKIFHVTPNPFGAGWQVKVRGAKAALQTFILKKNAINFARGAARIFREKNISNRGSITIHNRFGRFATSK